MAIAGMTLFCQDIREEVGGLVTLVGVLPDNIAVQQFPAVLPQLGIFTRINIPSESRPSDVRVVIQLPDGTEDTINHIQSDIIETGQGQALEQGNLLTGIVSKVTAANFLVTVPGIINIIVRYDDTEVVTGRLAIKATIPSE